MSHEVPLRFVVMDEEDGEEMGQAATLEEAKANIPEGDEEMFNILDLETDETYYFEDGKWLVEKGE